MDWVRDIVLNMHGQDLTALKNAMDDGGDAHNIHKLIYNDILVCSIVTASSSMSVAYIRTSGTGNVPNGKCNYDRLRKILLCMSSLRYKSRVWRIKDQQRYCTSVAQRVLLLCLALSDATASTPHLRYPLVTSHTVYKRRYMMGSS